MQNDQMAMFQQLMQNPQMLQRLQDPQIRGQIAQQLAGQFQSPPPEALQALGQPPQMGLSNPQQSLPGGGGPQGAGGQPSQTNPFVQGITTPLGSGVPVQYDRNGVPQTPFLPIAPPNQASIAPQTGGGRTAALGQAASAFGQAQELIPGGVPQVPQQTSQPTQYQDQLLQFLSRSGLPFGSPFA